MVWSLVMAMYALVAKINGIGVLGTIVIKFLSWVTLIYFGYQLIQMVPQFFFWEFTSPIFTPCILLLCVRYIYVVRKWCGSITRVAIHICVGYGCVVSECKEQIPITLTPRLIYTYILSPTPHIKFRIYPFANISRESNFFFLVSLLYRNDIYIYTFGLAHQVRDVIFTMLKINRNSKN